MTIETGNIGRFWDDSFKSFPYIKQPVTQEEIDEWNNLGYYETNVKSFTGSMYDNRNPMPEWLERIEDSFGLYRQTYTFYRMDTCEIMPVHSDHFRTYCRINNTTPDKVYRAVMMLEDWKPGHYFEMDGVGYVNWKAGDWFKWQGDVPHAASNIGPESRYSLQITGMSMMTGQLNKLFMFNIPDSPEQLDIRHPNIRHQVIPYVLKDSTRKVMVYMNNGYIKELDDLDHSMSIDDVHIYLYEPLCSYEINSTRKNFYSEFHSDVDVNNLRADELDSIYNYAKRNNMYVTVHTGDYNSDKCYPYYNDHMRLVCDDLFLTACGNVHNLDESINLNFNKKFISLNWRFTKHRQFISTYLAGKEGYLSWYHNIDSLDEDVPFDLTEWKHKHNTLYQQLCNGCELINSHGPYTIDVESNVLVSNSMWPTTEKYSAGVSPALYNKEQNTLEQYYRDIFVDIVTESRYAQPTANFSEKVLQAIQYQKPFILVAPPYTLEYLKSYGFKTFNEFWDESYDSELDHGERLAKILYVIDDILNKPIEELRLMYEQMLPVVKYNLELFKNIDWNRNET